MDDEHLLGRRDRARTDRALALTGKDVGTPIIHVGPPDGVAFFGFAELERSLRETPRLRGLGVEVEEAQQDA